MKKIVIALFSMLVLVACNDDDPIYVNPDESALWINKALTVGANQWKLEGGKDQLGSYYYADFAIPELTDFVVDNGAVILYFQNPEESRVKNAMPYVLHKGEFDDYGDRYYWTQTYDYEFWPGHVRVFCTYSDFLTGVDSPDRQTFHLVAIY